MSHHHWTTTGQGVTCLRCGQSWADDTPTDTCIAQQEPEPPKPEPSPLDRALARDPWDRIDGRHKR